ncbi:RIP metalloprotease RseP [Oleiagrimonas sp. C23AA]|uniref:RIP metalloprotease RseP n=1 Tax=Oleiagrimonas sp. C23AA TaxID=2719047 RepID=UPI00141EB1C6|nr:RIP metalloprotease RseP [Oleiagrimonas sp. C23AA]NII12347.1 RIP metalloprotease RseP [Oleiagrimonas sp. C23AA]
MSTFFGSVWWLLVTLGLLVTFHEFGHFWVARRCGVKVLRFSVGFGRALWSRVAADGTEYRIAAIPLGGYVKMLDAREGEVPAALRDQEFTAKSVWKRIAIVAAGPGFNFIFAIAAFWLMFMIGKPDTAPIIATPPAQTLAAQAKLHQGERIVQVGDTHVSTWSGTLDALTDDVLAHQDVALTVTDADHQQRTVMLALSQLPADVDINKALDKLGLAPAPLPPVIDQISPDSPAASAGLRHGDRINAINGVKVDSFTELGKVLKAQATKSAKLSLTVQRDGQTLTLPVTARWSQPEGAPQAFWNIGVSAMPPQAATRRYGPLRSLGQAFATTWDKTSTTLSMIGRMLTGHASTKNLSGVITIAQVANTSAHLGFTWFLEFLGLVSLSLAVLNLLPIPILDGGHLLYYLIELVKGSPVSERAMMAGQFVGMALLATLVGLAFYNDILRLAS